MASSWNTTVVFGCGTQRGHSSTGFHRHGNQGVFSGLVYRGDSRSPEDGWISTGLLNSGFQRQQAGVLISGRTTSDIAQVNEQGGQTRGVVSATTSLPMATGYAIKNDTQIGWVYMIYVENEPWAAEASMNLMGTPGREAADAQREIMFREIPPSAMFAARQAKRLGPVGAKQNFLVGKPIRNPAFIGIRPWEVCMNDRGFQTFFDAAPQVLCE